MRTVQLATALLVLVTAGCTSGRSPAPVGALPLPSAGVSQTNHLPRDRIRDGGTVTVPIPALPTNFNFNHVDGNAALLLPIMPSLFTIDAAGTPHPVPDYLADVSVVSAPEQVVTYRLDPRAHWSDGTSLTWQDLYWQWRAMNGSNPAYAVLSTVGYDQIRDVTRGADDRDAV